MKGFPKFTNLVAAISLCLGVIWPATTVLAAPAVDFLETVSLGSPAAIDIDGQGNLYVVDGRDLVKINNLGNEVARASGYSLSGVGVAYNPKDGRVYASAGDRVQVFDSALGYVGTLGAPGLFQSATGIDVLPSTGEIYVADAATSAVTYFDYANLTGAAGSFSVADTAGKSVYGLCVDPNTGDVYVSYSQNVLKVVAYDKAGTALYTLPASGGFGTTTLETLKGVDIFPVSDTAGAALRLYTVDFTRGRVAVSDVSGTAAPAYAFDLSGATHTPAGPIDIAFDPVSSRLFVTDAYGVQVYGIGTYSQPQNHAPSVPVPQSPVGSSAVGAQPVLSYQAATDLDGDPLTYTVEVVNVGTFSGLADTSYQVTTGLQENACYQWRVKASDGVLDSAWSATQDFCVNAVNSAPSAPVLQSLLDGRSAQGGSQLVWQGGVDADPNDLVSFTVELAADSQFAGQVVSATVAASPVALQDLSCYASLIPGTKYFWRVTATDSASAASVSVNAGSFVFGGTRLAVSANMPDAKVYLGGNHAYAGRFVGVAPVELSDIPAGAYTVVVERAGFEPFVVTRQVANGANAEVAAVLQPAYQPWRHVKTAGGLRTYSARRLVEVNYPGVAVAPLLVDFDSDGVLDLLVMQRTTGQLDFYKGLSIGSQSVFAEPQVVLAASVAGGSPAVLDWNNDGRKDLLIGAADGTVALVLNSGSETAPVFTYSGNLLQLSGGPLSVSSNAVPAAVDIDADGDKDLVVGGGAGEVVLFVNNGTDAAPQLADGVVLLSVSGAVAPFVSDWNADGLKDLLLATDAKISVAFNNGSGFDAPVRLLGMDLYGRRYYPVGKGLRVFALDLDMNRGKDLLVGDDRGSVQVLQSYGTSLVPAFYAALVDKVDQIAALTSTYGTTTLAKVADLRSAVVSEDMAAAVIAGNALAADLASGSDEAKALGELLALLQ